jgi:hypothetical protein
MSEDLFSEGDLVIAKPNVFVQVPWLTGEVYVVLETKLPEVVATGILAHRRVLLLGKSLTLEPMGWYSSLRFERASP